MLGHVQGTPVSPADNSYSSRSIERKVDSAFAGILDEAVKSADQNNKVTISNHAQKRLNQNGFHLNETDMQHLEQAVETLDAKGSRQSLILYDDLALIASIKNKTVITALKANELNEVTNIDSAFQINEKR